MYFYKKHIIQEEYMSELRKEYLSESIADNLPGVIYRCNYDDNWTMYFISDYIEKLTGYTATEIEFNRNISYKVNLEKGHHFLLRFL